MKPPQEIPKEEQYIDAEETFMFTDKDKISFRLIILHHFKNTISSYSSKRIEDFLANLEGLYDSCYPFLDDKAKKQDEKIQKEITKIQEAYPKLLEEQTVQGEAYQNFYVPRIRSQYRKLFRMLTDFLKRNNFFKAKDVED